MKKLRLLFIVLIFTPAHFFAQFITGYGLLVNHNDFLYTQENTPFQFNSFSSVGFGAYAELLKNEYVKIRPQLSFIQRGAKMAYMPANGFDPKTGFLSSFIIQYEQVNSNVALDLNIKANILVKKIKPFVIAGIRELYSTGYKLTTTPANMEDFTYPYFGKQLNKFNFDVSAGIRVYTD